MTFVLSAYCFKDALVFEREEVLAAPGAAVAAELILHNKVDSIMAFFCSVIFSFSCQM